VRITSVSNASLLMSNAFHVTVEISVRVAFLATSHSRGSALHATMNSKDSVALAQNVQILNVILVPMINTF
jgi:hypothetical protein